jgi:hypothetical protein
LGTPGDYQQPSSFSFTLTIRAKAAVNVVKLRTTHIVAGL